MTVKQPDNDPKIKKLFETAHKDRNLKLRLLEKPREVAKEWGVELGDREVERLTKLGGFLELANEAKFGRLFFCDPLVCYPVTVWLKWEVIDLIRDNIIIRPPDGGVTYPGPILHRVEERLDRILGLSKGSFGGSRH